jgi:hypothetical protein
METELPQKIRAPGLQAAHYRIGSSVDFVPLASQRRTGSENPFSAFPEIRVGAGTKEIVTCSLSGQSKIVEYSPGIGAVASSDTVGESTQGRKGVEWIGTCCYDIEECGDRPRTRTGSDFGLDNRVAHGSYRAIGVDNRLLLAEQNQTLGLLEQHAR